MIKKPELLAPAGSLQHLRMAIDYGADAVYAGIPRWSLRVRGNGFNRADFAAGIAYAHEHGRKFFAVLNVIPHMRRVNAFDESLHEVAALKPDALIMADPGLIDRAIELYPEIPVHLSVQANTVNAGTVKFWQKIGVKRCILARELSLNEIAMIREACPDMELEVFIHGALCIAVSGRCLISGLLARRDANLGACNNSCRWNYRTKDLALVDADGARKSLLYCLGDKGLNVIAEGSYHAETINLMADNLAELPEVVSSGLGNEVDLEQIMVWDPDVIIFAPDTIYDTVADNSSWQQLTAISTGNYYKTPYGPYGWLSSPPSVQRYLGMLWLGALLYPDYCEYDLQAEVTEYYKLFYQCELTQEMYDALMAGALPG